MVLRKSHTGKVKSKVLNNHFILQMCVPTVLLTFRLSSVFCYFLEHIEDDLFCILFVWCCFFVFNL